VVVVLGVHAERPVGAVLSFVTVIAIVDQF